MHMPDLGMIIVHSAGILDVILQLLRQREQRIVGDLTQVEISLAVFLTRVRTDLQMEEPSARRCFVDELIHLFTGKRTIYAKQCPGDPLPVSAGPVLDVLYGCLDLVNTFGIACFDDRHALWPTPSLLLLLVGKPCRDLLDDL